MDKPTLVEADMEAGKVLLRDLDEKNFDVEAALWFYMSDSEEWRLILASTTVDSKGPKVAYEIIQSHLKELEQKNYQLSLQNISVVSPNDNLIKLLKKVARVAPGASPMRFRRNTIDSVFVEDAYIYRMQ